MTLPFDPVLLVPGGPIAAFVLLGLAAITGIHDRLPGQGSWIALSGTALALWGFGATAAAGHGSYVFPWAQAGGVDLPVGFVVDPLAIVMVGLVLTVTLCVQVYSTGYMRGEPRYAWYFSVLSLFVAAMLLLVLAGNLLLLYVAWELVGFCSYLLIGFYYDRRSAAEAAKKAFVTTRIGDVGLLIGILILFSATGSFQMDVVFAAVSGGQVPAEMAAPAALLILLGAMGKSAQFPLHVWLPDAMEGPTPVSALIHAATMVAAGVYLVARAYPLFLAAPAVLGFLTIVGLLTTLGAAGMALVATDIKRVIAYSTVSKLGFMMVVLGSGAGFGAAVLYLVTHGFFKALLFLGAGSVIHATGLQDLDRLGGLGKPMRLTAITLLIASLALAGIPPLSGFWSKDEALRVLSHQGPWVYGLALASVFLSALYSGRLWLRLFTGTTPADPDAHQTATHDAGSMPHAGHPPHEAPPSMAIPMVVLAALSAVAGFVVFPAGGALIGMPHGWGGFLYFGHPEPFHLDLGAAAVSTGLTLAGLAIAGGFYWWGWWRAPVLQARLAGLHRLLEQKFFIDAGYQWTIDRVALRLGRAVAWFDRRVVNDTGVNGPGVVTIAVGGWLRRTQTGSLPQYALTMAVGVLVLLAALLNAAS